METTIKTIKIALLEKDKTLYIPQNKLPSPLELNSSKSSGSIVETVSEKMYQETHQPKFSVANALSLITQTITENYSVPVEYVDTGNAFGKILSQECKSTVSVLNALELMYITVTGNHRIIDKLGSEFVDKEKALGRITCKLTTSRKNMPRFRVATESGYAVRVKKKVNEIEVRANELSEDSLIMFDSDTAIFVKRGDRIPLAAVSAVIPAKDIISYIDEMGILYHSMSYRIKYGQNIMRIGEDVAKGEIIINRSTHISSREVMLLAATGCKRVNVFKKLSIGVMAIQQHFEYSRDKFECNRLILISVLKENNFDLDILDLGITDDPKDIIENITTALEVVNLLVITGHFSDKYYMKNILKNHFNATFLFENVDMKPGKSTAFATCYFKNTPKIILCLPEKPASVFVTAYIFFLPLVKWIHFVFKEWPGIHNVKVNKTLYLHSRPRYVWANLSWYEGEHFPRVTCNKISSSDTSMDRNDNAILILPPKTPKKSILKVSSQVPALLVKFPFKMTKSAS